MNPSPPATLAPAVDAQAVQLGTGIGVLLAGRVVGRGLFALSQIALARWLGPALYGIYVLGWSALQLAAIVAPLGLDKGIIRYGASFWPDYPAGIRGVLRRALPLALMGGVGAALTMQFIAQGLEKALGQVGVGDVVQALAVALPFMSLTKVLLAATRLSRRARYEVYVEEFARPATHLALLLPVAALRAGLDGAAWSTTASFAVAAALSVIFVIRLYDAPRATDTPAVVGARPLLAFSLPTVFADGLLMLSVWVTPLLLGYLRPAAEVGIYQGLAQLSVLFALTLRAVNSMFAPVIAALHQEGQRRRLDEYFKLTTRWAVLISLPVFLTLCFAPGPLITLVFGPAYAGGRSALRVLTVAQMLNVATGSVGYILVMTHHQRDWLTLSVIALALNAGLCLALAPSLGLTGAALANLATLILLNVGGLLRVRQVVGIWPYDGWQLKALGAGSAAAAALLLLHIAADGQLDRSPLAILALTAGVALLMVGGMTWALGPEPADRALIDQLRRRLTRRRRPPV